MYEQFGQDDTGNKCGSLVLNPGLLEFLLDASSCGSSFVKYPFALESQPKQGREGKRHMHLSNIEGKHIKGNL